MARTTSFTKRALITKANSRIVVATSVAAFVLVFTLIAGRSLIGQIAYQNRVIDAKKEALATLQADLEAVDEIASAYKIFVSEDPNVLSGDLGGQGAEDGDNAKIVLDALPSKYDFPALTTSLEGLIIGQNLQILSISGTDEEVAQQGQQISSQPAPVAMPFKVEVNGSYDSIQNLTSVFLRSIRPFKIQSIELSGGESGMTALFGAQTYYQPEKSLRIESEVVK